MSSAPINRSTKPIAWYPLKTIKRVVAESIGTAFATLESNAPAVLHLLKATGERNSKWHISAEEIHKILLELPQYANLENSTLQSITENIIQSFTFLKSYEAILETNPEFIENLANSPMIGLCLFILGVDVESSLGVNLRGFLKDKLILEKTENLWENCKALIQRHPKQTFLNKLPHYYWLLTGPHFKPIVKCPEEIPSIDTLENIVAQYICMTPEANKHMASALYVNLKTFPQELKAFVQQKPHSDDLLRWKDQELLCFTIFFKKFCQNQEHYALWLAEIENQFKKRNLPFIVSDCL